MSGRMWIGSAAHATFLVVAPLWAVIAYGKISWVAGIILVLVVLLTAAPWHFPNTIYSPSWVAGVVAGMGVIVGLAAIEGYSGVSLEGAHPPVMQMFIDFLVRHDWATASAFTAIVFVGWLLLFRACESEIEHAEKDRP